MDSGLSVEPVGGWLSERLGNAAGGKQQACSSFCTGPGLLAILLLWAVLILQSQPAALFHAVNLSPLLEWLCHKLVASSAEATSILLAVDSGSVDLSVPVSSFGHTDYSMEQKAGDK